MRGETLLHVACRKGYERYLDLKDELDEEDREEQARRRELPPPGMLFSAVVRLTIF